MNGRLEEYFQNIKGREIADEVSGTNGYDIVVVLINGYVIGPQRAN